MSTVEGYKEGSHAHDLVQNGKYFFMAKNVTKGSWGANIDRDKMTENIS